MAKGGRAIDQSTAPPGPSHAADVYEQKTNITKKIPVGGDHSRDGLSGLPGKRRSKK